MPRPTHISRREFLRLSGLMATAAVSPHSASIGIPLPGDWPELVMDALPPALQEILEHVPQALVDENGLLHVQNRRDGEVAATPLARTQFNIENSKPWHRMRRDLPWGIVLHWYGDYDNFDRSIAGYLRGFDGLREINGDKIRTSSHFVVGVEDPALPAAIDGRVVGYLQTQAPDTDGTPFMSSHVQSLDFLARKEGRQYFLKALDLLSYHNPHSRHLLQTIFENIRSDPNRRTISIEISGHDFDREDNFPGVTQTASVLGLVWALMKRYKIPAKGLLGHYELNLGKADPGKNFLSLMRHLLGVKALVDGDEEMLSLVFGQYVQPGQAVSWATRAYFKFVRDYLVLTTTARQVYNWERISKYWFLTDLLPGYKAGLPAAGDFFAPLPGEITLLGNTFLNPAGHEGLDLYRTAGTHGELSAQPVHLIATGMFLSGIQETGAHGGFRSVFRHRQPDGAEILTVYSHLARQTELTPGKIYPAGQLVGETLKINHHHHPFLHFSLGFGATWETAFPNRPLVPLNAEQTWIMQHFLNPDKYDFRNFRAVEAGRKKTHLFD